MKELQEKGSKKHISLPDGCKEYLAVYTTEYDDSYVLDVIAAEDLLALKDSLQGYSERIFETEFNFDTTDNSADLKSQQRIVKIRKLNQEDQVIISNDFMDIDVRFVEKWLENHMDRMWQKRIILIILLKA